MTPARYVPLRLAAALLAPAFVAALIVMVAGSTTFVACGPCNADIAATIVITPTPPPESCLDVQLASVVPYDARAGQSPKICGRGSELLEINNGCASPLSLTSVYFIAEGTLGHEGGAGVSSFLIPAHSMVNLLAGPNATGSSLLSLSGTIAGTPIEITIFLSMVPDAGALADVASVDTAPPMRDSAAPDSAPPRKDTGTGRDAAKDATMHVDAGHDAGIDAGVDASADSGDAAPESG